MAPRRAPLMLLYSERGQELERALNPMYASRSGDPVALWKVPGSGNVGGLSSRPREYERRVVGFFDDALSTTGPGLGPAE